MSKPEAITLQAQFLRGIEDVIPSTNSLVNELSEVLEISTDSAYRRMRGDTLLTIDEIIRLCDHYQISFDAFSKVKPGLVTFNYTPIEPSAESYVAYLSNVLRDLKAIEAMGGAKATYACQDIPFFYHFNYPVLANFKTFYWMRTIMNLPDLNKLKFDADSNFSEILEIGKQIYDTYLRIPSVEIWTSSTIQSTIMQIAFYWDSGVFESADDALRVCAELSKEIEDLQHKADSGNKLADPSIAIEENNENISEQTAGEQVNYQLYISEIELTNNCIMINVGSASWVYLSHFSFNSMVTRNQAYSKKTEMWLSNILKKSTLISGTAEKQRFQFFQDSLVRIDELMNRINSSIEKK